MQSPRLLYERETRMKVSSVIYGKEALEISKRLNLVMSGDEITVDTKVTVVYRSVEGHGKIIVSVDI